MDEYENLVEDCGHCDGTGMAVSGDPDGDCEFCNGHGVILADDLYAEQDEYIDEEYLSHLECDAYERKLGL